MKRVMLAFLITALLIVSAVNTFAQWPLENHYKVYDVVDPYTFTAPITLYDQFGEYAVDNLVLDHFANPVRKNNEPIIWPEVHQTWWSLYFQTPGFRIVIDNQFGVQMWDVGDAVYLVNPALKDVPGDLPVHNHYLAYEATGPAVHIEVTLEDQWSFIDAIAVEPALFLNPVEKQVDGNWYPIIDEYAHLACYTLEPPGSYLVPLTAYDQFGIWQLEADEHCWLCLPTWKLEWSAREETTWSTIKTLYRD